MSDLISRQALCDDLREYKVHPVPISSDESEVKGYNDGIDLAISVIAEFPSAELEQKGKCTKTNCPIQINYISNDCDIKTCPYRTERKIGKWKNIAFYVRKCSECGKEFYELEYDNFCPNCGANMRGNDGTNKN